MIPKKYIIIAPHADDEIIGCWTLFDSGLVDTVIFGEDVLTTEVEASKNFFGYNALWIQSYQFDYSTDKIYLFPDPVYELHPYHRALGHRGEELLRAGKEVVFYTTNMLTPYIFEVPRAENKHYALNTLYPQKSKLWKYEHKYFLFEGYNKWIFKWPDL